MNKPITAPEPQVPDIQTRKRRVEGVQVSEIRYNKAALEQLPEGYLFRTASGSYFKRGKAGMFSYGDWGMRSAPAVAVMEIWPTGEGRYRGESQPYAFYNNPRSVPPVFEGKDKYSNWFLDMPQDDLKREVKANLKKCMDAKREREEKAKQRDRALRAANIQTIKALSSIGIMADSPDQSSGYVNIGKVGQSHIRYSKGEFTLTTRNQGEALAMLKALKEYVDGQQ